MNSKMRLLASYLLCSSVIVGCGGGASGTGGIVGDLNPSQKIETINEAQTRQLCDNTVALATSSLNEDHASASVFAVSTLIERYVDDASYPPNGGSPIEPPRLKPAFENVSQEQFQRECETLFSEALSVTSQQGACFDVSQLPGELSDFGQDDRQTGSNGACDLRNPSLGLFDINVGEYSECMSQFISEVAFSPTTSVRCEAAYDVFKTHDWSYPFDLSALIPFPQTGPSYLPEACRAIQKRVGRASLFLRPVGCLTGLQGSERVVFPTVTLTDD